MIDEKVMELAVKANERDPRSARYGYFSGSSFVLASSRAFHWFESIEQLSKHLLDVELRIYDLEDDQVDAFREALTPLLYRAVSEGLTDSLRKDVNQIVGGAFVLDWWGSFDELTGAETEFSKTVLRGFLDLDATSPAAPLHGEALDEFVEYLLTFGV
jgi:hypothetical protein